MELAGSINLSGDLGVNKQHKLKRKAENYKKKEESWGPLWPPGQVSPRCNSETVLLSFFSTNSLRNSQGESSSHPSPKEVLSSPLRRGCTQTEFPPVACVANLPPSYSQGTADMAETRGSIGSNYLFINSIYCVIK